MYNTSYYTFDEPSDILMLELLELAEKQSPETYPTKLEIFLRNAGLLDPEAVTYQQDVAFLAKHSGVMNDGPFIQQVGEMTFCVDLDDENEAESQGTMTRLNRAMDGHFVSNTSIGYISNALADYLCSRDAPSLAA